VGRHPEALPGDALLGALLRGDRRELAPLLATTTTQDVVRSSSWRTETTRA
jgi:hypothetical protein